MAGASYVDKLPRLKQLEVIKALTLAGEAPDFRKLIDTLKLKCSHHALWRYHRYKIKPTLQRQASTILSAMDDTNVHQDIGDSFDTQIEQVRQAQSETIQRLKDDPIVQAAIEKRKRLLQAIEKTHSTEQWDVYSKLEGVDIKAIELMARGIQHPGWSTAAPAQTTNNIVLMLPGAGVHTGNVIDIEPVE